MAIKFIGLTGGIGVGKSAVAEMFRHAGVLVISADILSRKIMLPGTDAYRDIVQLFGKEVETRDGLDRRLIRDRVFRDPKLRKDLERITHPRILDLAVKEKEKFDSKGVPVLIFEAAVLIEAGAESLVDELIVVTSTREQQRQRASIRDDIFAADIDAVIDAQMSDDERKRHATYIIDNSGSLDKTKRQVEEICKKLGV